MLGEIEKNMLKILSEAQTASLGYHYGSLTILNAPAESDLAQKMIAKTPAQTPALWFHHDSHKAPPYHDGEGLHFNPIITMWFQTNSLFNQGLERQKSVPGLYQLMLDAAALLSGETCGLMMKPLQIDTFELLPNRWVAGNNVAVGKISFQTRFTLPAKETSTELDEFHLIWLNHTETTDYLLTTQETS